MFTEGVQPNCEDLIWSNNSLSVASRKQGAAAEAGVRVEGGVH